MKLALWLILTIAHPHQVIENTCLTLPAVRLLSTLTQCYSQLAGEYGGYQEDKQGNPLLNAVDGKDIQRWDEEKIEREKGHHGGKDRSVASTCARQRQNDKQIHNRDVGNTGIELEHSNDPRDQHRSYKSQHAIEEILLPGARFAPLNWQ